MTNMFYVVSTNLTLAVRYLFMPGGEICYNFF